MQAKLKDRSDLTELQKVIDPFRNRRSQTFQPRDATRRRTSNVPTWTSPVSAARLLERQELFGDDAPLLKQLRHDRITLATELAELEAQARTMLAMIARTSPSWLPIPKRIPLPACKDFAVASLTGQCSRSMELPAPPISAPPLTDGQRDALDAFVREHHASVTRLAYRLLGWRGDVEDVVHDVFLAAFKKLDRFRSESSTWTWLAAITINRCRSDRRHASTAISVD